MNLLKLQLKGECVCKKACGSAETLDPGQIPLKHTQITSLTQPLAGSIQTFTVY